MSFVTVFVEISVFNNILNVTIPENIEIPRKIKKREYFIAPKIYLPAGLIVGLSRPSKDNGRSSGRKSI